MKLTAKGEVVKASVWLVEILSTTKWKIESRKISIVWWLKLILGE